MNDDLPFVDRRSDLRRFRGMLRNRKGPWLLWIVADAGEGKSRLLEKILETYGPPDYKTSQLLDFFDNKLRTRTGILDELCRQFGVEEAVELRREHAGEDKATALITVLKSELRQFKRGIIAVDTVELIAQLQLSEWFFTEFLPKLNPYVVVIACGRDIPPNAAKKLETQSKRANLSVFAKGDVADYLSQRVSTEFDQLENASYIRDIHNKTGGEGQAFLVALMAERMRRPGREGQEGEIFLTPQRVRELTRNDLDRLLVDEPLKEDMDNDPIVRYLAHSIYGLSQDIILRLNGGDGSTSPQGIDLLDRLKRYPYIKYHEDVRMVRFHDLFSERALKSIWPEIDPDFEVRRRLSDDIVKIMQPQYDTASFIDEPLQDQLYLQYLYHLLYADRERAYGELWKVLESFERAGKQYEMDALLSMADRVNKIAVREG